MSDFKVKIYVLDEPKDPANGKVFHFPIIPRVGDNIDISYKQDIVNEPPINMSGVFAVKKVWLKEVGSNIDAELHVKG